MQEKKSFELNNIDNRPLFSILVPVYNVQDYIETCIKSVLCQSVYQWELWLVNDGSTDNSGYICHQYAEKDPRIHVLDKENSGLLSARRIGIKHARGAYSIFLDSDDFLEMDCLSKLANIVEACQPDIIMYTGYLSYGNGTKRPMEVSFKEGIVNKDEIYKKIISSDEINAIWTKCIKTFLLQEDDTDYTVYYGSSYGEDKLQFLYPITISKTIYYLPVPLYNYRQVPNSMIHNLDVKLIEKKLHLDVWNVLFDYVKKWGMWDTNNQKIIGAYFLRHLVSTFSVIYEGANSNDKKSCINYKWKENIPRFIWDSNSRTLLTRNEKLKLICMLTNNDSLLKLIKLIRL